MSLPVHVSPAVDSTLKGTYVASPVKLMVYGRGTIKSLPEIISQLGASKAVIITGQSLSTKTPIIDEIKRLLGLTYVATFNKIGQHASRLTVDFENRPISAIKEATELVKRSGADVLISVGGGSPIDSAKAVAYRIHEENNAWIPSIAVPTTLSVAETTQNAGYTTEDLKKVAVSHSELVPKAVIYDGDIALYTPLNLWTSTGIRALDHAVELLYHPLASEIPTKRLALEAIRDLFTFLPLSSKNPKDADIRQKLLLACYASLFPFLYTGGVGLSHSIGHSLGATYGIPHGITSCLTLSPVINFKADTNLEECEQISRILPYIGIKNSDDVKMDSKAVSSAITDLVGLLGHKTSLTEYNVPIGEEDAIAEHAVAGGRQHPHFEAVVNIVKDLY